MLQNRLDKLMVEGKFMTVIVLFLLCFILYLRAISMQVYTPLRAYSRRGLIISMVFRVMIMSLRGLHIGHNIYRGSFLEFYGIPVTF